MINPTANLDIPTRVSTRSLFPQETDFDQAGKMVLLGRIELPTSSLPIKRLRVSSNPSLSFYPLFSVFSSLD